MSAFPYGRSRQCLLGRRREGSHAGSEVFAAAALRAAVLV